MVEQTMSERDRKLKIKRIDKHIGKFGYGITIQPYYWLGLGAYVKYWPCTKAHAIQISFSIFQVYICWMMHPEGEYRT